MIFKNGYDVAVVFKYYLQFTNKKIVNIMPVQRIQAKMFYKNNKNIFDKCYSIFTKYNINIDSYIDYFINVEKKSNYHLQTDFLNMFTINNFVDYLKINEHDKKIYSYFQKSVKNIAKLAIKNNFLSTKDFLKHIIYNKLIGQYYMSGIISKYYLTAIPNMKLIIPKLDQFSQNELLDVYNKFESYNTEITKVFLKMKNQKVNPIKLTDKLIFDLKNVLQTKKNSI